MRSVFGDDDAENSTEWVRVRGPSAYQHLTNRQGQQTLLIGESHGEHCMSTTDIEVEKYLEGLVVGPETPHVFLEPGNENKKIPISRVNHRLRAPGTVPAGHLHVLDARDRLERLPVSSVTPGSVMYQVPQHLALLRQLWDLSYRLRDTDRAWAQLLARPGNAARWQADIHYFRFLVSALADPDWRERMLQEINMPTAADVRALGHQVGLDFGKEATWLDDHWQCGYTGGGHIARPRKELIQRERALQHPILSNSVAEQLRQTLEALLTALDHQLVASEWFEQHARSLLQWEMHLTDAFGCLQDAEQIAEMDAAKSTTNLAYIGSGHIPYVSHVLRKHFGYEVADADEESADCIELPVSPFTDGSTSR